MTFQPRDLAALESLLLSRASAVIPLREVHAGNHRSDVIGLRHDIDDNSGSFQTAQTMARWEAARGYRSTYYVLHGAHYWTGEPFFRSGLEEIALAGHEIGLHVNGLAEALRYGKDPHEILWTALDELRSWGHAVIGCASHGDSLCHDVGFVNYEQFDECKLEDPYRVLSYRGRELRLTPMPLSAFGLAYEAYHIPRGRNFSESGGRWNTSFEDFALGFNFDVQLHLLQHPDWWGDALSPEKVAA